MISPILSLTVPKSDIKINKREALRYMGYRRETPDQAVLDLFEKLYNEISGLTSGNACYRRVPVSVSGSIVRILDQEIQSTSLARNLENCSSAYIFAATAGPLVDRSIIRYEHLSATSALIADCLGSAAVEGVSDSINRYLQRKAAEEGKYLRPRFSPGYGDFLLEYQNLFLSCLNASLYCGITLTDSNMMVPVKSVSAIVGISDSPTDCTLITDENKCIGCDNWNCVYRG